MTSVASQHKIAVLAPPPTSELPMLELGDMPELGRVKYNASGIVLPPRPATPVGGSAADYAFVWVMHGTVSVALPDLRLEAGPDTLLLGRRQFFERWEWSEGAHPKYAYLDFTLEHPGSTRPTFDRFPRLRQLAEDDLLKTLFRFF